MSDADSPERAARNDRRFSTAIEGGWIVGPTRFPTNNSSHEAGTIHDDRTARELGYRGGTIAGSLHFEQFLPLCEYVFGREWQRSGGLSLYFLQPSLDGEPVRAMINCLEEASGTGRYRQVAMSTAAGMAVLEGTASLGGIDPASKVRERLGRLSVVSADRLRILGDVREGFSAKGIPTRIPQQEILARLPIITETRREFSDASLYGHAVAPLSAAIHALRVFEDRLPVADKSFVGMFGAIEWQYLQGPVFADYPYQVNGRVVAVRESPKTEMLWYECTLHDPATSKDVARMLMLSRLLKATSPLWQGAETG